jgi:tRNA pseudouridine13 synthase
LEERAAKAESVSRDPSFNPQSEVHNPQSGRPDTSTHVVPKTYITSDLPPIGGVIKQRAEDFLVDEAPLYQPSGSGEHIYLLVQKRGLSTMEMVEIVAAHFAVPRRAVGYAGLKDKHAITRQVVSVHVPGRKIEDFGELRHEKISVLWADYHGNKLRPGHLRGNRFSVRIRGVKATDVVTAQRVLARLAAVGVPNRVGEQRFGMLENNHLVGRAIVAGEFEAAVRELVGPSALHPEINAEGRRLFSEGRYQEAVDAYPRSARAEQRVLHRLATGADARRAVLSLEEPVLRFYLSAFQSAVFNAVLDARIAEGTLGSLREGDLALKHENGAVFAVGRNVLKEPGTRERLSSFEISPSGPMWGGSMIRASGETDRAEVAALEAFGATPERLKAFDAGSRFDLEGKRRPLRVPVIDPEVEGGVDEHGAYVRCAFELPRGAFATVVMREVMKPEGARGSEWEEHE